MGDWKLVKNTQNSKYELFNLKNDPFEKKDLSKEFPEKFSEMHKAMTDYLSKANKVNWKRPSQR